MSDEPVIREQLPTHKQETEDAVLSWTDELIEHLLAKGLYAAAHEVSMKYWGYGLEDTDDEYVRTNWTKQADVARNVAFNHPDAVATRNAEYLRINAEREASLNRAYPEGVRKRQAGAKKPYEGYAWGVTREDARLRLYQELVKVSMK